MSNIILWSEIFDNGYWDDDASTPSVTYGQIDPQGGSTAALVTDSDGGALSMTRHNNQPTTAGQEYTLSIFVKKDASPTVYPCIVFGYTSNWRAAFMDPSNGDYTIAAWALGDTVSVVEDYNTEYWRWSVSGTANGTGCALGYYPAYTTNYAVNFSESAAQGSTVFWGAQFELGSSTTAYDTQPLTNDTSDIAFGNILPLTSFATTSTILCTPDEILFYCNESRIYTNLADITCDDISYPSNLLDIQICLPPGDLPLTSYVSTNIADDVTALPLAALPLVAQAPDILLDDLSDVALGTLTLSDIYNPIAYADDVAAIPLGNLPLTKYSIVSLETEITRLPLGNLPLSSLIPTAIGDDVVAVQVGNLPLAGQSFIAKADDVTAIPLGSLPLVGNNFKSLENDITWIPVANLPFTPLRIISTLDANVVCTVGGYTDVIRDDKPVKVVDRTGNKVVILKNNPVVVVQDLDPIIVELDPIGKIVQTDYVIRKTVYEGEDEQEIMYSKRVDFINDNLLYRGEAEPGIFSTQSFWRIRKITISDIDDDIVEIWADGNDNFDKVWDNHLSYQYT